MTSILLVDDEQLILAAVERLFSDLPGLTVIGTAHTAEQAIQFCKQQRPDLIFMDLQMPGMGGLIALKRMLQRDPTLKIIILSTCTQEPYTIRALKVGAKGYLSKSITLQTMQQAIQTVMAGNIYIDPKIADTLALRALTTTHQSPFEKLSKRELDILIKIAQGLDLQQISTDLCITGKTINSYRYRIHEKLNLQNDVQLTLYALNHGLLKTID